MKDIFFKDCYIIRVAHVAMDIQIYRSGPTYIDNVVCENIYVDTDRHADRPIYQKQENQIYEKRYDDDYMPILFFIGNAYEFDKPLNPLGFPADVNYTNVAFRNIHVTGHRMPQSILKTIPGHMRIENVSFDGIYLGDKRFESFDDMNIFIGSDAKNVTLS